MVLVMVATVDDDDDCSCKVISKRQGKKMIRLVFE